MQPPASRALIGRHMPFDNRVTRMLGVEVPIVQAPMGWIARSRLAAAVSNAGALGIIETSSGELDAIRGEIRRMRELTDRPFGVNIAQAFVRDPGIVDFVVEGAEGGGFKNPRDVSTMVLLPLVRSQVDVPIIAAGGICDGPSMAAAFALGAEGVQMGTRMVSAVESPVHERWKQAIVDSPETGTLLLKPAAGPALRALRTERTERLERGEGQPMAELAAGVERVYFQGDLEAGVALTGQVAGRIDAVRPVAEILEETLREFHQTIEQLAKQHLVP
jgi:enoyl-[acyl-carrier protein] reductase II